MADADPPIEGAELENADAWEAQPVVISARVHTGRVNDIVLIPGRGLIVSSDTAGGLYVWDLAMKKPLACITVDPRVNDLLVMPDEKWLVIGSSFQAQLLDLETMKLSDRVFKPERPCHIARMIARDSSNVTIDTNSSDYEMVQTWNIVTGQVKHGSKKSVYHWDGDWKSPPPPPAPIEKKPWDGQWALKTRTTTKNMIKFYFVQKDREVAWEKTLCIDPTLIPFSGTLYRAMLLSNERYAACGWGGGRISLYPVVMTREPSPSMKRIELYKEVTTVQRVRINTQY